MWGADQLTDWALARWERSARRRFVRKSATHASPFFGVVLAIALAVGFVEVANGQALTTPPPIVSPVDANGVNLATGTFNVGVPEFSIGPRGSQGLGYSRYFIQNGWTDSTIGAITQSGTTYTVSVGGTSESFTLSGGVYSPAQGQSSTLTYNSTSNYYTYTAPDGTVATFYPWNGVSNYGNWLVSTITHPNGLVLNYYYTETSYCIYISGVCTQVWGTRFTGLESNLGWVLIPTYASNTFSATTRAAWLTLTNMQSVNNAIENCNPSITCGPLSTTYPNATFTATTSPTGLTDTDALGRTTTYTYNSNGTVATIARPSGLTTTISYNSSNQVSSVSNGTGTWSYGYVAGGSTTPCPSTSTVTTTVTDPLGHTRTVLANLTTDEICTDTDGLGRTTSYTYDSYGRLTQITYPLGNEVQYAYNGRGDVTSVTQVPVSGSGLSNIVASAGFDSTCTYPAKCNKPNSITDGNGNVTNYTYDTTYGVLLKVDPPVPTSGATEPETRYSYTQLYAYYYNVSGVMAPAATPVDELTGISTCQTETASACPGTADEVKTTITRGTTGVANNLQPTSIAKGAGDGSLTATVSKTYDDYGDVATYTGPLGSGQTTAYVYDYDRERLGVFGPETSTTTHYPTTKTTYNSDGLITKVERGTDTSQSDPNFTNFTSLEQRNTTYDSLDRVAEQTFTSGGTTYNVIQYTYDNANRLTCSAVRMNASAFSSLPSSACTLGTEGSNGNDRITENTYDNANELTQITAALGDPSQANYVTNTYTNNSKLATVLDADNNLTTYTYDGLDRLSQINYPVTTQGAGTSDSTDYEAYTYDANSNVLTDRRRSNDTITYVYDALNRVTEKEPPSWSGQNVFYSYDLLNRTISADFGSVGGTGVAYTYDALSRKTSETAGSHTLSSQYDSAGDRTQITWPDSFYVNYVYDYLQRPTQVEEEGATSGVGLLGVYTYDSLGRLTAITRGNGADTSLGYNSVDLVSALTQDFTNSSSDVTWDFTYDAANSVLTRTATNDSYTSHPGVQTQTYVTNGLNQYSSLSGTSFSYDGRGNLTSDGTRAFTFDVDNKLLTGSAPTSATFTYDPLGRMQTDAASGATTTFLYDGQNLSAEYNSSGTLLNRYVPSGLGMDRPLVWYVGSGTSSRRWLHTDNQGSIIAYSDSSGDADAAYSYDPYGEPASWAGSRYSYTGQLMVPENDIYNYKARVYDSNFGRFLNADPIGYAGGINTYSYGLNDPVNERDPTGQVESPPIIVPCPYPCGLPPTITMNCNPDDTECDSGDDLETIEENQITTPDFIPGFPGLGGPPSQQPLPACPSSAGKYNPDALIILPAPDGIKYGGYTAVPEEPGTDVQLTDVTLFGFALGLGGAGAEGTYTYKGVDGHTYTGIFKSAGIATGLGGSIIVDASGYASNLGALFGGSVGYGICDVVCGTNSVNLSGGTGLQGVGLAEETVFDFTSTSAEGSPQRSGAWCSVTSR
jgi:RHS repeat-associated protein